MTVSIESKIQALEIAVSVLKMTRCPYGEWPSVRILQKMIQELKGELK